MRASTLQRKISKHLPTKRQAEVLAFIHGQLELTGVAPTTRELAAHFGIQSTAAYSMLLRLKRKGLVTWESNKSGTLRPLEKDRLWLPMLGKIS